ncbi:preprotein translocase subunit SecE [Tuwongella immobilis]|uniref:Protein translocase subunit SecE n=1 Tax=Tuwongella immobilis TaxID=692036 RepID=A0A6C2YMA4_9BACT|nr:preprotein translocase subunit SecE [Tuwongella immobilis]VIP02494.1 preprotein translocase subunit : Protein translocase subunit SecE OS=Rhodopirellula europaea 6C GN=secE PE=3 SV=1: SecE [Tuwongella immobilis]VTS01569.1 preprotein translocase subunit : Protein translocase subunit SecE OS=Rhodopirellula europaea 6C GN=secE PE=3 SV=1: SecE [Tuwongella immobilis]
MAVAESTAEVRSTRDASPVQSGMIGAIWLLLGIGLLFTAFPSFWTAAIAPSLTGALGSFMVGAIRLLIQVVGLVIWVRALTPIVGAQPPVGTRGGIFFGISMLLSVLFTARAIGLGLESIDSLAANPSTGLIVFGVITALLLAFGYWVLNRKAMRATMVAMEEQGWMHLHAYKGSQGQLVRRLTIIGLLVVLLSGVSTLASSSLLDTWTNRAVSQGEQGWNDWLIKVPFSSAITNSGDAVYLMLLPDLRFTIPMLLILGAIWFAVRIVNFPVFADFLIATEAEMNKVSWVTRKRLVQDTIVVLVTVLIMTVFLFVVDGILGKSLTWLRVLPSTSEIVAPKTSGAVEP